MNNYTILRLDLSGNTLPDKNGAFYELFHKDVEKSGPVFDFVFNGSLYLSVPPELFVDCTIFLSKYHIKYYYFDLIPSHDGTKT